MSGGGGSTVSNDPWKGAQPYLLEAMRGVAGAYQNPADIYAGPTTLGYTARDAANYQNQLAYANAYTGAGSPLMGAMGAANASFSGQNPLAQFGGGVSNLAGSQLSKAFGGGSNWASGGASPIQLPSVDVGGISQQNINPLAMGGVDATSALQSMLSGRQGMDRLSDALASSDSSLVRNFEQTYIPQLNQQTLMTNNLTGSIKGMNWGLSDLGSRMSDARNQMLYQAQQAANQAQQQGVSQLMSGSLQQGQLAQTGAIADAQLRAQQANQNAANQLQAQQLGLQAQNQQQQNALSLGQLGAGMLGQDASNATQWASLYPQLANLGMTPANITSQNVALMNQADQQRLSDAINAYNAYQQQPQDMAEWYLSNIQGTAGLGGTQKQKKSGGGATGALGGAAAGAQMGSAFGPWGTAIGAIGGGLIGAFS